MTPAAQALLAKFEAAAVSAKEAEAALHKRMAQEIARAERERGFAYRKVNLLRALIDGVASAKDDKAAIANGTVVLRAELGWENDSDTRSQTLGRFAPVLQAIFAGLESPEAETDPESGVASALADFEAWYEETFKRPFWVLFDREIEELPLVER
jgi:hypothetical protein